MAWATNAEEPAFKGYQKVRSLALTSLFFFSSFSLYNLALILNTMHAIGIDMSKATFHAAVDDRLVKKFTNTADGIDALLSSLTPLGLTSQDIVVGVEATGVYHLLLCTRLTKTGYRVMLINPLESHRFVAAQSLRRRKTDTCLLYTSRCV